LPRVIAAGAGATSHCAVGTPVFGGMLAASVFGIFIIPMLYVVFQQLRLRVAGAPGLSSGDGETLERGAPELGE
jgi:hypothetical protein